MSFEIQLVEDVSGDSKVYSWYCPLCGKGCPYQRNLLSGYVVGWAVSHLTYEHNAVGSHLQAKPRIRIEIEPGQYEKLQTYANQSKDDSVESLVGLAIEAFIRKTEESV